MAQCTVTVTYVLQMPASTAKTRYLGRVASDKRTNLEGARRIAQDLAAGLITGQATVEMRDGSNALVRPASTYKTGVA